MLSDRGRAPVPATLGRPAHPGCSVAGAADEGTFPRLEPWEAMEQAGSMTKSSSAGMTPPDGEGRSVGSAQVARGMDPAGPPAPVVRSGPQIEIVAPSDLLRLEREWAELWLRCPRVTPFGHPSWLLAWVRHYAPGRCSAVALRDGRRLVALLPVFCWDRALLLAGTGPSDRGEVLVMPGFEAEATRLVQALPEAAPEPFDCIDLQQLDGTNPLLAADLGDWAEERLDGDACLLAPLRGEHGLDAASGRQRSHWRQELRRLHRQGGTIGLVPTEDTGAAVEDLLTLNARRWGEQSVLRDRLLQALLRDAAPALAAAGLLRLHQVVLEERRIAVLFALAGRWAHHGYNSGYDPDYARFSPSAMLVGLAMSQAAQEGCRWFDFLRGHEGYKSVWGAAPIPMHRRILRPFAG